MHWAIDRSGNQALVNSGPVSSTGSFGLPAVTRSKIQIVNLKNGELKEKTAEPEGAVLDLAMSPSGRRAAVLLSGSGPFTQLMVWDIDSDRYQFIPLSPQLEAGTAHPEVCFSGTRAVESPLRRTTTRCFAGPPTCSLPGVCPLIRAGNLICPLCALWSNSRSWPTDAN